MSTADVRMSPGRRCLGGLGGVPRFRAILTT